MSQDDFFNFVAWARDVPLFLKQCHSDKFEDVLKAHGFSLTPEEFESAKKVVQDCWEEYEKKQRKEQLENELLELDTELVRTEKDMYGKSLAMTQELLKGAINNAQDAFKNLRFLSNITFFSGLVLIFIAVVTGIILEKDIYSLIFGGIGTVFVFTVFFLKPKEEIQTALSNLLQAEIIFLDYHNQIYLWAPYIRNAKDVTERQNASQEMHSAAANAVMLLQSYLEPVEKKKDRASCDMNVNPSTIIPPQNK